ncbi:hypothetical protein STRIP9103_03271 [Streptomyces ipomoeae 91-03]|uniref:Uncharacterized protein n=1 Tax=Streptomyces ipomoeae 91-03 TaxID=698759 RepID=L1KN20_9ACTN|nr:hypothetical protein STRIP9103_03271 [Streptomyces ipomoeae 91-03]
MLVIADVDDPDPEFHPPHLRTAPRAPPAIVQEWAAEGTAQGRRHTDEGSRNPARGSGPTPAQRCPHRSHPVGTSFAADGGDLPSLFAGADAGQAPATEQRSESAL